MEYERQIPRGDSGGGGLAADVATQAELIQLAGRCARTCARDGGFGLRSTCLALKVLEANTGEGWWVRARLCARPHCMHITYL